MSPRLPTTYIRNFIFGVEDSLVSTVGLLSGVAAAGISQTNILLTGIVLICVEAFSMAVGSFLSESSALDYENRHEVSRRGSLWGGLIMFCSYFVSGFIPLWPYLIYEPNQALRASIVSSVAALFILGALSGRLSETSVSRSGIRMALIGGIAIMIGILVGQFLKP